MVAATAVATEDRQSFYKKIDQSNVAPLWEVLRNVVTTEPNTPCEPYLWQWEQMKPWLLESAGLISTKEAERRVLVLENPGLRGRTRITHSLYAGLQIILPGEIAPSHRHSQTALRFIVDGSGAYTAVNGEQVSMNIGDLVITPSWTFHDHGNPSDEPMVWLDVLDLPLVELLDAQFFEEDTKEYETNAAGVNINLARFGNTLKPVEYQPRTKTSPLFWYPYERTREALEIMRNNEDPHACWGHKLQYTNPVTGGWAMPSIGTFMQILPAGFKGQPYRSTDSTIYVCVEGKGRCLVDGQQLEFGPRDVFVCPSWKPYRLEADSDTVLFSSSDRPIQQAFDLWRETIG